MTDEISLVHCPRCADVMRPKRTIVHDRDSWFYLYYTCPRCAKVFYPGSKYFEIEGPKDRPVQDEIKELQKEGWRIYSDSHAQKRKVRLISPRHLEPIGIP